MRVLLVANYPPDHQESMLRFAGMLQRGMSFDGIHIIMWQPPVIAGRLKLPLLRKWLAYVDKYIFALPSLRRAAASADLVHILDHSNAVYGPWLPHGRWLVTCHDLLAVRSALGEFPQRPGLTGRCLQQWILGSLKQAPRIVCDSEATLDDARRLVLGDPERGGKLWVGLNHPYQQLDPEVSRQRLAGVFERRNTGKPNRYIFHVGGDQWYKNRLGVLQIYGCFRQLNDGSDVALVMAGAPPSAELLNCARRLDTGTSIVWLGRVNDDELEALYNNAECLLFPSLAEGFGWPVIEALACGCPVMTSNRAPMTEIGAEACVYIDPEDVDSAAGRLSVLLADQDCRSPKALAARTSHVSQFDPVKMAESYRIEYIRCLESFSPLRA